MISEPPRHTKTETVTVRYAAWRLERDPGLRICVACYNQLLANRYSRKIRRICEARGVALAPDSKAVEGWETLAGGGVRAVGVGSGVTGQGFDLILIDDPIKSREEADSEAYRERLWSWYTDDLYTRLEPGAAIVLIMTRWHEDDLAGRILASEEGVEWTAINLPALAEDDDPLGRAPGEALCPARYPVAALQRLRRALGERGFNALYQGRPSAVGGNILRRQWWRYWYPAGEPAPEPVRIRLDDGSVWTCPQLELPASFSTVLQSWDCAFKGETDSDFVCGQVWGLAGARKFCLDYDLGRYDFPDTLKAILRMSARWPAALTKLIEDKANGPAVIATLNRSLAGLIAVDPAGGKVARANAIAATVEAGDVYLPHPSVAPWSAQLVEHCAAFPRGAHDDDVDALTQALHRLIYFDWSAVTAPRAAGNEEQSEAEQYAALMRTLGRGEHP